jgi:hypothetical protein
MHLYPADDVAKPFDAITRLLVRPASAGAMT